MKTTRLLLLALLLATSPLALAQDAGLGVNLPIVGKLSGGGGVEYKTSITVSNNRSSMLQARFFFDGQNVRTGAPLRVQGGLNSSFAPGPDGSTMYFNPGIGGIRQMYHSITDDFVGLLRDGGHISSVDYEDGVLGSVLFVFPGTTSREDVSVNARFHNPLSGGTVGVALEGRSITGDEPRKLSAVVSDTRGRSDSVRPKLYPNLFLNNVGLTPSGDPTSQSITVRISATSLGSSDQIGSPLTITLAAGHTASISAVLDALNVPALPSGEKAARILAEVIQGDAALHGLVSLVDAQTRDGSLFYMSRFR